MRILRLFTGLVGLAIANLIPLYALLFWGWSSTELLFCFWIESFVIGIFTMLKISKYGDGFLLGFFPVHYGLFMLVHLVFLVVGAAIGFFGVSAVGSNVMPLLAGMAAFFVGTAGSHALSYFMNFVGGKEWKKHGVFYYFILPYGRIIPMHLAIILGAVFGLGPIILYGVKLIIDVLGYCIEHSTNSNKKMPLEGI